MGGYLNRQYGQHSLLELSSGLLDIACAGGLSAVNAIGTQLRDLINLGLTRWRMTVDGIDGRIYGHSLSRGKREEVEKPASKKQIQPWVWRMSRLSLARNGTTEPISRNQIIRREREHRGKNAFSLFS